MRRIPKILVRSDDTYVRQSLTFFFSEFGGLMYVSSLPYDGEPLLREPLPDAIILDHVLHFHILTEHSIVYVEKALGFDHLLTELRKRLNMRPRHLALVGPSTAEEQFFLWAS